MLISTLRIYGGKKKRRKEKTEKKTDLFTPLLEEQCREGRGELRAEKSGNGGRGGAISSIIVFFIPRPFFFARPPSPPPSLSPDLPALARHTSEFVRKANAAFRLEFSREKKRGGFAFL